MFSKNFEKWDTILGWAVFFIALIVYATTVEPTNSFWDAGEYIATSAKLQVGHPPGAPLLQMIGAFFALFAFEPDQVARMVNYVSGVSSAFTILFMFWTITNLVRKLMGEGKKLTNSMAIAVLGSGVVGSLAFTFSDSFWFNAVETEVYSMASFIMALLLWLGLKWTDNLEDPRGDRWLVLISFVVGLTFGIQFMGFLAIPSIGLLYYFKTYKKTTIKNFLIANVVVIGILMLVYKFSLTYVLKLFGWGEVFFINSIGLPFNSGSIIIGLLFVGAFYCGLRYTRKNNFRTANTIVLCLMFLFLGFSSWIMLPIRANANVVINENNPADARALLAYYNREQYPGVDSPVYGTYYSDMFAPAGEDKDEKPKYEKDETLGKYVIVNHYEGALQGPNPQHRGILPRMWSGQNAENYMKYFGPLDFKMKQSNDELRKAVDQVKTGFANGEIDAEQYISFLKRFNEYLEVQPPTVWQNIKYMFEFQFGYMYWRYFMWNFAGKENDVQGRYNGNGNWLSGIPIVDAARLGSQDNLPTDIKENKARNTYFFLPLILGLIGLIFQVSKNPKQFWVLAIFFLFTGIAIQFYTNPSIFQPRERDYSLVGSFYVFSLWIGLGVYGLFDEFKKWLTPKILAPLVTVVCLLAVPSVMAYQNWDDHDRSNRYTANASAKAYLDSCQEDVGAILFTIGDNDTFPLWYAQEIEGYRTDVRIVCTSLFETDWYVDQMKRKAYESDPIPSQITHDKYRWGSRDVLYHQGITENRWPIKDFVNWLDSDKPQTKLKHILQQQGADLSDYSMNTQNIVYYPTNKIRIPVNKKNVLESGLVKMKDSADIVDYIDIDLPTSAITKKSMMMLDILANNDWKRPIYFSGGSFDDAEYIWMKDYLQLDGMAYKLVPIKTERKNSFELGRIDSDLMYDIVMKWDWGNSGSPDIYHDPQTRIQSISYRSNLARLVETLVAEEKIDKAKDIINLAMDNMPVDYFGYYTFVEPFVDGYFKVGETTKARELFEKLKTKYQERLEYYSGMTLDAQYNNIDEIISDMEGYRRNIDILINNNDRELAEKETLVFNEYIDKFDHFYKSEEPSIEPESKRNPDMVDTVETLDTMAQDANSTDNTEISEEINDSTLVPQN
ncbi:protein O-mannosyl-transferase family [Maribacter algicola]|uniref:Protein O-mannosyl-transferase family n=1 Tax=Meishania litoralis TaxID=3434685 RepID=A0ACC7LG52_9FLAO